MAGEWILAVSGGSSSGTYNINVDRRIPSIALPDPDAAIIEIIKPPDLIPLADTVSLIL